MKLKITDKQKFFEHVVLPLISLGLFFAGWYGLNEFERQLTIQVITKMLWPY
jgi:hypothetical protein